MTAEEIIYDKMQYLYVNAHLFNLSDIHRLAHNAVEEIREEFRKTGVDVWPTEGRG